MQPMIQQFQISTRIFCGNGALAEITNLVWEFGPKVLIVTGKDSSTKSGVLDKLTLYLRGGQAVPLVFADVEPEPSLQTIVNGLEMARANQVDWVIGLGGGSAMDAAKAIAGLYRGAYPVADYFQGCLIESAGIPLVTIPTTAGSGAEVTINAVLSDPAQNLKQSIRDPRLAARVAIVDPELTLSLPQQATVYSGIDALVQAIEAYTSKGAGPLTDVYAVSAIERIGSHIIKAYQNGQDLQARTEMLLGSLMAGIALANARLGAVHGLAHSVGIRTGKPHGLVCAVLLVPVMRFNLSVCYEKYAQVARALGVNISGLDPIDAAAQAVKNIMFLEKKLGLPAHIKDLGLAEEDFAAVAANSISSGSLKANPRPATEADLVNILKENF